MFSVLDNLVYSKSQGALIRSAYGLFYKYGIKRVSVDEICAEAKLSKMTFYRAFKDKADIAYNVLYVIFEGAFRKCAKLSEGDIDFKSYLMRLVEYKIEYTNNISAEFVTEVLSMENPKIFELIELYQAKNMELFLAELQKAKLREEVREDLKPEFTLYLINDMNVKMQDPALSSLFESPQAMIVALMEHFFYGILINK